MLLLLLLLHRTDADSELTAPLAHTHTQNPAITELALFDVVPVVKGM